MKYSQLDPRWRDIKLGNTNLTIGNFGCYMDCLAMLSNTRPDIVNKLFTENHAYKPTGEIINEIAYPLVGLTFQGRAYEDPRRLCIGTTDYYATEANPNGRHFFILKPSGLIVDPLNGRELLNKYRGHIVSYRLFKYGT